MDSNSFLLAFGMQQTDFERSEGPIQTEEGFLYEAWEARKPAKCPRCGSASCIIKDRYTSFIKLRSDMLKSETLIRHRIKYVCKGCRKTFTVPLKGAMVGKSITYNERALILAELNSGLTFSKVAEAHRISTTTFCGIASSRTPTSGTDTTASRTYIGT